MPSVLRAILLDPEARANDMPPFVDANGGKLRDPILWWASIMRTMQATSGSVAPNLGFYESRFDLWLTDMGETPRDEPSVFSYYSPDFQLQGTKLFGPEFQNENAHTLVWMTLHVEDALGNNWNVLPSQANEFSLNLGPGSFWYAVAAQNSTADLVNVLDALLMHGMMTEDMQQSIINAVSMDDPATKLHAAVYLIVTSPQYRLVM